MISQDWTRKKENMNRPITSTEIWISNFKFPPTNKSHTWILSNIREEITLTLLKLFQKIGEKGTHLNSFYEATVILIMKIRQNYHKKRKLKTLITDEHSCKSSQQNTSKPTPNNTLKGLYTMMKWELSKGCRDFFQYLQINQCDIPHSQTEE